ncbi:MAG: DUF1992 domain-containing protein, partial [Planctomycetes bacterium]|nr:DUF1992 domain-containing protein [Planctomycetota bacterium]
MDPFFHLVEQKLEQAERDGVFARLPGQGRPLVLDDLDGVPAELRASYLLLKGSGFVPPELEARREWLRLEDLLAACADAAEHTRLAAEARRAALRYRLLVEARGVSQGLLDYRDAVLAIGTDDLSGSPAISCDRRGVRDTKPAAVPVVRQESPVGIHPTPVPAPG